MNANHQPPEPPGLRFFNENQNKIPLEYLIPYDGKHVAWSADGTQILVSGDSLEEVEQQLTGAGIEPSQVVLGFVDIPR
jgi:hypothetical protein